MTAAAHVSVHKTSGFQPSLLDAAPSGDPAGVAPRELAGHVQRTVLGDGAWIDVRHRWMAGADELFEQLRDTVAWRAERRPMYDRVVTVPRLLCFVDEDEALPHPSLTVARESLDQHYAAELGERFVTAGLCLYRDGHDSVAWHGDRIGRGSTHDTMVAIAVLGEPRALLLRPRPGLARAQPAGPSRRLDLGHGDLVVMGGSCQRTWEHAVPKTARPVGPRISVQFRPRGVR